MPWITFFLVSIRFCSIEIAILKYDLVHHKRKYFRYLFDTRISITALHCRKKVCKITKTVQYLHLIHRSHNFFISLASAPSFLNPKMIDLKSTLAQLCQGYKHFYNAIFHLFALAIRYKITVLTVVKLVSVFCFDFVFS